MLGDAHPQVPPSGHPVQGRLQSIVQFFLIAGFQQSVLNQLVIQAPAVEAVQIKILVVGVVVLDILEAHLESTLIKGVDGLFQESRQIVQADGLFGRLVRKCRLSLFYSLSTMSTAPFPFIGK